MIIGCSHQSFCVLKIDSNVNHAKPKRMDWCLVTGQLQEHIYHFDTTRSSMAIWLVYICKGMFHHWMGRACPPSPPFVPHPPFQNPQSRAWPGNPPPLDPAPPKQLWPLRNHQSIRTLGAHCSKQLAFEKSSDCHVSIHHHEKTSFCYICIWKSHNQHAPLGWKSRVGNTQQQLCVLVGHVKTWM